jgi:hypothetical protein
MTTNDRKRKRLDDAIDTAITVATQTRDASDASPLLGPLKVSMNALIAVLKNAKVDHSPELFVPMTSYSTLGS